jgi:hypothetical protein
MVSRGIFFGGGCKNLRNPGGVGKNSKSTNTNQTEKDSKKHTFLNPRDKGSPHSPLAIS